MSAEIAMHLTSESRVLHRAVTERLQSAIIANDLALLEPVLAKQVRFGSCVGRAQVLQFLCQAVRWPARGSVEIDARADRLLITVQPDALDAGESPREYDRYVAVFFVRGSEVVELQIVADREAALAAAMTLPPAKWSGKRASMTGIAAIVPVRDLDRALEHYRLLGFCVNAYGSGGYGFAERDGMHLHFSVVPDLDPTRTTSAVYFYVDDADALFAEWRSAEVSGQFFEPGPTAYGLREGAHIDLDGNLLRFGSPAQAKT